MTDRPEVARAVTAALDAALDKIAVRGVSDIELGRAALATGLSRLSRSMSPAELADHLAGITVAMAETGDPSRGRPN